MYSLFMNALVIFVLVVIGLFVLFETGFIDKNQRIQKMGGLNMTKRIIKLAAGILCILGIAFLLGSFLAYIQNITVQIVPLLIVGVICLLVSLICIFVAQKK